MLGLRLFRVYTTTQGLGFREGGFKASDFKIMQQHRCAKHTDFVSTWALAGCVISHPGPKPKTHAAWTLPGF